MLLLDTNALVWWMTEHPQLGRRISARLRAARQGQLGVSVLTWFEMSNLHGRQGLRLRDHVPEIRRQLTRDGLVEFNLTAPITLDAAGLAGLTADPFDRLIVATARESGATLVTTDESILAWHGKLERMDARK